MGDYRGSIGVCGGTVGVHGVQHHGQWQRGSKVGCGGSIGIYRGLWGTIGVLRGLVGVHGGL